MTESGWTHPHAPGGPLSGLVPQSGLRVPTPRGRIVSSVLTTLPIVLIGSMVIPNATLAAEQTQPKRLPEPQSDTADLSQSVKTAIAKAHLDAPDATTEVGDLHTTATPGTYRVKSGDTVSGIAARYGLATASVLALNGLSWKSTIFPGQVLKLSKGTAKPPTATSSDRYTIRVGDTVSSIASRFGVSTQAVLSANGLGWSSIIYPGKSLTIPGKGGAVSTGARSYTIKAGDTITAIAKKSGVSVQRLLDANGLRTTSIIYAGRKLTIPGATTAGIGARITPLSPEMAGNAAVIVRVGKKLGVTNYGIVIALAAAMQESSLRNIDYGDRDSVGLFQQRPSAGWGRVSALMNPEHAARLFYGGPTNPNRGTTRGLLDIPGWSSMTVTQAAQKVQISAFPDAYAKWEASARYWLDALT